jgi:hypothetical protein
MSPEGTQEAIAATTRKKEVIVKIPDANEAQTPSAATNQEIVAKVRRDAPEE